MTNNISRTSEQGSISDTLFNVLAGMLPVLAGVLTFALFATV